MRNAATALAATLLLGLGAAAREASAGATVDLLFVGHNASPIAATSEVTASAGDLLTMAVMMRNDEPLTGAFFSLNYDLDGDNELDVVSALEWSGIAVSARGAYFGPLAALTSTSTLVYEPEFHFVDGVGTFIGAMNYFSPPKTLPAASGAFAGGYQMGTVVWKVNAGVNTDGVDIISGILNPGMDVFADANFYYINNQVLFHSATVNAVPEPGSAGLLALGLLGLGLASRRHPA